MGDGGVDRIVATNARDRVVGAFEFAVDRRVDGVVHACAVRSSVPHALIKKIDASEALADDRVLAVITGQQIWDDLGRSMLHGESRPDQPVLALHKVRYTGEPVALVVAESRAAAADAARLVDVDYEELPHAVDPEEAGRPDAPLVHDDWPGNDCGSWSLVHGDAEAAMATATHVHTETFRSPTQNHAAMEPHVCTAHWSDDQRLTVWSGTQAPYVVRNRLAGIFSLAPERVRVVVDNIGGGFGSKLDIKLEAMVAYAARVVRRPVRMELTREEVFYTAARHSAVVTVTTGCDDAGRLVARIIDIVYNAGAYAITSPRAIRSGMIRSPGPYEIPHVLVRASARYTNTVPTGPFRGAMTGQVCWAHESAMDSLAAKVGLDPLEIRRRNVLRDGSVFATGEVMHDMHFADLLEQVAEGIGWDEPVPEPRDGVVTGRGIALVLKSTRTPSRSEAAVRVDRDGRLAIRSSSVEMGQGSHVTLTELVARQLGVSPECVGIAVVDTDVTPFDTVTSSSRTTLTMGLAVEAAARDLKQRLEKLCPACDSNRPVRHEAGAIVVGDEVFPYADLLRAAGREEVTGWGEYRTPEGYGELDPVTSQGLHTVSWHQGAVGVVVEVDTRTGRVRVVKMHGTSYAGRAVDAERVRKQTEGGMIFGLGQALMEEVLFEGGELVNNNLSDYQVPSVLDWPTATTSSLIADDDPGAPPHGVGENTVPPMAPAIGNAIFAATGVRIRDLPLTGERVLAALRGREE